MMTNTAPDIPMPGYPTGAPSPKRRAGQAWQAMWDKLSETGGWLDGNDLAQYAAEKTGLRPVTTLTWLTRARAAGILEVRPQVVTGARGKRSRTFYRIKR